MIAWRFLAFGAVFAALPLTAPAGVPEPITVAAYNLRNFLVMERYVPEEGRKSAAKPETEVGALVAIIAAIDPDVLGVCEIGTRDQVDLLQQRLKEAGVDLPEVEYVDGTDERHLALLSRFPIVHRRPQTELSYELNGSLQKVRRGFLDVTLQVAPDYQLRLVGAHLKSKRPVPEGEALIRRNEAHLLRKHVSEILAGEPETNLLVYGDFNDTKNEPAIREIIGAKGQPDSLYDLWLKDSVGDRWTYYWQKADVYSRVDFMFVSRALKPEILDEKSYIFRSPDWATASDHRPTVTVLNPVDRE